MLGLSPVAGRLYDGYGRRFPIMIGSFLHLFDLMMTSLSTKYYQSILNQSPMTHSHNCRALAGGFAIPGSSLGGVVFLLMMNHLLSAIGFAWTMRACTFLILGLLLITCTLMSSHVTHTHKEFKLSSYLNRCGDVTSCSCASPASSCIVHRLRLPFSD
ncbi:MFS general substrate transporter [Penicillium frequentans]|uniref:MFS general substrate transporter n=1 Tax=Penicillium frequentans TaxID=3151616 RepID=A0AAD6D0F5_9EURO|nr:MFS general substrate transporter [Penicillium glabrum]